MCEQCTLNVGKDLEREATMLLLKHPDLLERVNKMKKEGILIKTKNKEYYRRVNDGVKPCCFSCKKPFENVVEVKSYLYNDIIDVWFSCKDCGERSEFFYMPYSLEVRDCYKSENDASSCQ